LTLTTEWNIAMTVRHIPDEELHSYLDQALSRSQAVEIERHLARCPSCQMLRDDIARLRDRTTELLAELGPPAIVPPAYATLQARAAERVQGRQRWLIAGMWAASVAGAIFLGWSLKPGLLLPAPVEVAASTTAAPPRGDTAAVTEVASPVRPPATRPAPASPGSERRLTRVPAASGRGESQLQFASLVETDPTPDFLPRQRQALPAGDSDDLPSLLAQPVGEELGLQGLWRTVVPDSSGAVRSVDIPLVPGLPVMQMRVQPGENGPDVTAVDQMLESGEVVRTLAGPTARVQAIVAAGESRETGQSGDAGTSDRVTVTIQQGDRMVAVTGPSQSLGSLLSRVNARRRY
jgi:hypothetical protein